MTANDVRIELLLGDARGIYIPRAFLQFQNVCNKDGTEITDSNVLEALEGIKDPDGEHYWDDWTIVLEEVHVFSTETDDVYMLYQDGDLFAISVDDLEALSDTEAEKFWSER